MGWVTLTARKLALRLAINTLEKRDIDISRQLRASHRQYAYDQSIFKNNKAFELREIKESYDEVRDERPEDRESEEYNEWYQEYQFAKEDYEAAKFDINEMYEAELAMIEEESQEQESMLQQEQTTIESQLEAQRAEYDVVKEQISKEIEESAIQI